MRTPTRIARVAAAAAVITFGAALPADAAGPGGPGGIANGGKGQIFISASDAVVAEGDGQSTHLQFVVKLSKASAQPVEIDLKTFHVLSADAADQGVDYEPLEEQRTFPSGTTQLHVAVTVNGDNVHEAGADELVNLRVVESSAGVVADDSALGRIQDNDPVPLVSVADVSEAEGTGGPTGFHFPVTLANPSDEEVAVQLAAQPGSAAEGSDWQGAPAVVAFAPGETVKDYAVSVVGDDGAEPDESFTVSAVALHGAEIADGAGTGTIGDDDPSAGGAGGAGTGDGSGGPGDHEGDAGGAGGGTWSGAGAGSGRSGGRSAPGRVAVVGGGGGEEAEGSAVDGGTGAGAHGGAPMRRSSGAVTPSRATPERAPLVAGLVLVALGMAVMTALVARRRLFRRIDVDSAEECPAR